MNWRCPDWQVGDQWLYLSVEFGEDGARLVVAGSEKVMAYSARYLGEGGLSVTQ